MSKPTQNEQLFVGGGNHKLKDSRQEEKKKNFFLSLGLIIFALCVTGATYAYFALTASNNAITGTVGGATLTLTVNKIVPTTQNTNMIPQLESTLDEAISSTYNCVDEHNNVVCHVYKATIANTGQSTVELRGTISFSLVNPGQNETLTTNLPNLKWKRITDSTTLGTEETHSALTEGEFVESLTLSPSTSQEYYFVVWIDETGDIQTDHGTFNAVINFESSDGEGLTSTIRPTYPLLSTAEVGSYVAYTGNNGCPEGHCDGTNANYVDDTDMGYCLQDNYKFTVNGWRIMAKDDGGVYIVSAGAPECMCTNADGTTSNNLCSNYVGSNDIDLHINNLNEKARNYCNSTYVNGGVCNETTAWAMAESDFQKITNNDFETCSNSSEECGRNNTLIDNGGQYWYATIFSLGSIPYYWDPNQLMLNFNGAGAVYGVRPVIYLASTVTITGGEGTYTSPYQISN